MELRGVLTRITVKKDASNNTVQTLQFEVHGEISALHNLMDSPLVILVEPE